MSWLIGTLGATFAAIIAYWSGREVGLRWRDRDRRRELWDRLDDDARRRALDDLNPVDPWDALR